MRRPEGRMSGIDGFTKFAKRWARAGDKTVQPDEALRPLAVVLGGGITGLSAAQELAERGFNVLVVEQDERHHESCVPDLGGVAKSQWFVPDGHGLTTAAQRLGPLTARLPEDQDQVRCWFEAAQKLPPDEFSVEITAPSQDAVNELIAGLGLFATPSSTVAAAATDAATLPAWLHIRLEPGASRAHCRTVHPPGEHGFRFFPAFYRNLFDTLRRIPLKGRDGAYAMGDRDPYRTVFDNLVPMSDLFVGLGDGEPPLRIPRRVPESLEELFQVVDEMYRRLDFEPRDSVLFQYELLRWMTASGKRRAEWSTPERCGSDGSWWAHIQAEKRFSKGFKEQLRASSMALVGMREAEIDARTYGNICVQLLLDQVGHGERVDYSLNGPTSEAWFEHWQGYLEDLGVVFAIGKVEKWKRCGAELRPDWAGLRAKTEIPEENYWVEQIACGKIDPDYWVCALPLPELFRMDDACFDDADAGPFSNVRKWKKQAGIRQWSYAPMEFEGKEMPFRTMCGVQFFSEDHLHLERGHTYFPRSEWWLSSVLHSNHWRSRSEVVRGVLSIDVSGFGEEGGDAVGKRRAWSLPKKKFALEVLRQFRHGRGGGAKLRPMPPIRYIHVDTYLKYPDCDSAPSENMAPYLINLPGQWEVRPGKVTERQEKDHCLEDIEYPIGFGRWVMAGPHCKTWTRLATMEAANESARHAVNAILRHRAAYDGSKRPWASVPVENLEDCELDDLALFREVDEKLCQDGVPHLFDVLELDKALDDLLGSSDEARVASAFEEVLRDRLGLRRRHHGSVASPIGQVLGRARKALEKWGERRD